MNRRVKTAALAAAGLWLAGCRMGPDYARPETRVPERFPDTVAQAPAPGFGDLPWFTLFQDPVLVDLIQAALKENADVQIAGNRVLQAEARAGIAKSFLYPAVGASADAARGISTVARSLEGDQAVPVNAYNLNLGVSWELDFWGRLRRQAESARASLLGSVHSRDLVLQSLVTGLAQSYFQLRELDSELDITRRTLDSRLESLKLVQIRQEHGVASMTDVQQALSLVQSAQHAVPLLEQSIAQQEGAINILLGRYQGAIPRGLSLDDQRLAVSVPPGLPSSLLERRPDVRLAEQNLVAANAQIGVAKAACFPTISLTGGMGYASTQLHQVVRPDSSVWNVGAGLTAPIFQGGYLRQNVRLSELQKEELVLDYTKSVRQAFVDVTYALVAVEKLRQAREYQQAFTTTLEDQERLSKARYEGGVTTYLEVLDSERQRFDAQRGLAQAKRDELLSVISLYKSLGGGWQVPVAQAAPVPAP
jgi:outer membrane protein, multidrug efflux system